MKLPISWLEDYVSLGKISVEELAERLTFAGLEVTDIAGKGKEAVFDIEVTTNRPDWLSVTGVAREAAAVLGKKLKMPAVKKLSPAGPGAPGVTITVEDKKGCPLYTGRVISGIKVGSSPDGMKAQLEAMDLRPVNNIVDITNFVLFELGQPMHAFDLDKLSGGVRVRRARRGEKITAIDGSVHELGPETLVIADEARPVAVAGVMGSRDTEVGAGTKNILLESAYFDPVLVRRAVRKLGLESESSYRFERGVDLGMVRRASDRAAGLIMDSSGGKAGKMIAVGKTEPRPGEVSLKVDKANDLLGIDLSAQKMAGILGSLGLKVGAKARGTLRVKIPSFRRDIKMEVDLIEEIARIWGYDKVAGTLSSSVFDMRDKLDTSLVQVENKARGVLAALGFSEVISYSLISRNQLNKAGLGDMAAAGLANPLSRDFEILRPSLVPGMLITVSHNLRRRNRELMLFELNRVYPSEELRLAAAISGGDLFDLKGAMEVLFERLGGGTLGLRAVEHNLFQPGTGGEISLDGKAIGLVGEVSGAVLSAFDIEGKLFLAEIDFAGLLKRALSVKRYEALARFPSVEQDISLVVDEARPQEEVRRLIVSSGGDMVKKVVLKDIYRGPQIAAGKKSLHYSIEYYHPQRTLRDGEVSACHKKICDNLTAQIKAQIR